MAVDYPASLPRPSYANHSLVFPQTYYATEFDVGQKLRARPLGNAKVTVSFNFTQDQINIFNAWFFGSEPTSLNGGTRLFTAEWLLGGIETTYELSFADKGMPKFSPIPNSTRWKASATLLINTDIFELIGLNSLEGICPEGTDCMYNFLIWMKTA